MSTDLLRLRPYQRKALNTILGHLPYGPDDDRGRRFAVVMPTGSGKTVLFAHLAKLWTEHEHKRAALPHRVLILVHRDELVIQAVDKLRQVAPGIPVGVVKAERNDIDHDVIVASVQTLSRPHRLVQLLPIGLVIVDECHHASAAGYQKVLHEVGCFREDDWSHGQVAVGFTATMQRGDGRGLGDVWEEVVFRLDILDLIEQGHLVDVSGRRVTVDGLTLSNVLQRGGDFAPTSLSEALMSADAMRVTADAYERYAKDRSGVVFTPDVKSAHAFADEFRRRGLVTEPVWGAMPVETRRDVLRRFSAGDVQVVTNCATLCLDTETEILADSGWVSYLEMTENHRVANWDQGRVFFKEPYEVVVRDRLPSEDMYVLETVRRSLRVTRGHRMLYRTFRQGQYLKAPVEKLENRAVQLPTAGVAEPSVPVNLTLDECRLIGFWLGDGTCTRMIRGGVSYVMSQANVYPHIIKWVDGVLDRSGIDYRRYDKSHYKVPHVRWALPRGTGGKSQTRSGVQHFEEFLDKDGTDALWCLNKEQFGALITGLWYADGNHGQAENGLPNSFHVGGCYLALLEKLQAIAVVRGWSCSLRRAGVPQKANHRQQYTAHFHRRANHSMGAVGTSDRYRIQRETTSWVPEKVWCVRTETRNIITRRRGSVTVMGNTEGWDAPIASCAVIARPTLSAALYVQQVGRVLRPYPGKKDALVLDVAGASESHRLATLADLTSRRLETVPDGESLSLAVTKERIRGNPNLSDYVMDSYEVDLFRRSEALWLQTKAGVWFTTTKDQLYFLWPGSEPDLYKAGKRPVRGAGGAWIAEDVPFNIAQDWCEQAALRDDAKNKADGGPSLALRNAAWRKGRAPASEAQKGKLSRLGVTTRDGITKREASDLISVELASRALDKAITGRQ